MLLLRRRPRAESFPVFASRSGLRCETDIWAALHAAGADYTIQVDDVSVEDIGKELDRDCHVALYGIHFDFNKATLRKMICESNSERERPFPRAFRPETAF